MLTDKQLRSNRRTLGTCTKLGFLPFNLQNEGRQMVLKIPVLSRIAWIVLLSAAIFYTGYINIRFLETLIIRQTTEFSEFAVHLARCLVSVVGTFWAYDGLVVHAGEKAIIYNYTNDTSSDRGERKKQAKSLHSIVEDQMLLNCASMLYPISFYFTGFFLWKTDSTQFFYAALPERWQTLTALTLCSLLEFTMVLFWMAHAHLFVIYNMLFQQKLQVLLSNELHFHTNWYALENLDHKVVMMREVQTVIGIHGVGNRQSIFTQKFICLSLSIAGFYFFIRLVGLVPVVPFMFLVLGINSICFYSVIWDSAYMIPTLMDELRREVLRRLPHRRSETTKDLKLRLKSVPFCGIQVGSFRPMERNSTLLFLDFVCYNLASLLISFLK